MVTRSTEEAMAVLKTYRRFLVDRGRYEAFLIAQRTGGVYSRQVRERMKELGFMAPGVGEYWLGAVFNRCKLFTSTGRTVTPPNLEDKDGNTHAGHPTHVWTLVEGATVPPKPEPPEDVPVLQLIRRGKPVIKKSLSDAQHDLVSSIHRMVDYWDRVNESYRDEPPKTCKDKLQGLAFSILCIMDGVDGSVSFNTLKKALDGPDQLHDLFYK